MAQVTKPVGGSGVVADTKGEWLPKELLPKEEVEALREKPKGETLGC